MSGLRGCLTFAGAICAAGPLAAQGLPARAPATDPAIVVTGKGQTQSGNEAFDEVRRLSRVERIHEEAPLTEKLGNRISRRRSRGLGEAKEGIDHS